MYKKVLCLISAFSVFISCFALSAFADNYCPTNYEILYTDTYSNMDFGQIPLGTLQRLRVGNDLVECYQPHTMLSDGRIVFETYGLYTHLFESSKSVSLGAWTIRYTQSYSTIYHGKIEFLLDGNVLSDFSIGHASVQKVTQYRYGFSLVEYNGKTYVAVIFRTIDGFPPSPFRSNPNYDLITFYPSTESGLILNVGTSSIPIYLLDPTAGGKSYSTEVDIEGGESINDTSVRSALTCPNCGGTDVTLIPQPMYDVGSEGGLIYKIRCNNCQNYWHWTFTANEKAIIEELNNDPESGYTITYENPVSDNVGDIFDLPRDENGNVIWGEAAGNFGNIISGTFNGLSAAAVSVVSIFGTVFNFLPPSVVALISFAVILCLFIGIFKTLRG